MNERIQELANKATSYCDTLDVADQTIYQDIWKREFAELIVKECLDMCLTKVGNGDYNRGRMDCHDNIKEHFGVEE